MKRISFLTLKYLQYYNVTLDSITDKHTPPEHHRRLSSSWSVPDSLDWRDYGVVGPVRKQEDCNSCWAFAAAGSLDYWLKKTDADAEVNVQSILDCTPNTYGCLGGLMEYAFNYDHYFPLGYDYRDKVEPCHAMEEGIRAISHVEVDVDVEDSLPYMIHKFGPVPVAIDFSKQGEYRGGVIKHGDCRRDPHHAVLVVGYTPEYWIIKNSMGTEWGDNGYAYVSRGHNTCGIDTYASVATDVITT